MLNDRNVTAHARETILSGAKSANKLGATFIAGEGIIHTLYIISGPYVVDRSCLLTRQ